MIAEGLLSTTNDKYSLLRVPAAAMDVLHESRPVIWKRVKASPEKAQDRPKQSGSRMRKSDILNSRGLELFEQLRDLRSAIAKEENMPPYIIFADKTLVDMCVRVPFDKKEMLKVTGVGENKFNRFGERFLSCIREYTGGVREKFYFGEE